MELQQIINKHSDYNMADPFWINLNQIELTSEQKKAVSDSLNEYFKKHGPDANEDFTSFAGPLMELRTAKKSLQYAFSKNKKLLSGIDLTEAIDGVGSVETDGP